MNGEIYNHKQLEKEHLGDIDLKTGSDCECLVYLVQLVTNSLLLTYKYQKAGPEFLNYLNGDFAFVLYDKVKKTFLAARDPAGALCIENYDDDALIDQVYVLFTWELHQAARHGLPVR